MDYTRILDPIPLLVLFTATLAIVVLSVEVGYRLGRQRRRRSDQEKEAPVGAIVAATLGLLAFMLAFTFGLAATRFDARRMVVLEESNAIGTAYLRAGLLSEPHRATIRELLRKYIEVRLQGVATGKVNEAIAESGALQQEIWSQATEVAAQDARSVVAGLFIQSLNDVIDLHSKRVMLALHNRIPELVWIALYGMATLAMMALGYQEGLAGSRRTLAIAPLAVTFSAVILLIADLDRPHEGMLRVSQRTLQELQQSLPPADASTRGD